MKSKEVLDLFQIIENNVSYTWYNTEEPFINNYNNKISYDYSGDVQKMTAHDLIKIEKELGESEISQMIYSSKLEELISNIYINQWEASYESNRGKNWVNFNTLLEQLFSEWKFEEFEIYDEETEEENEELDKDLDDILCSFLENTNHELYYTKILNRIK